MNPVSIDTAPLLEEPLTDRELAHIDEILATLAAFTEMGWELEQE